jgi:tetratricopeptide (TPR) repeat protein
LLRAKVLQAAWTLAYLAGDYAGATAFLDQGLTLARECGDPVTTAVTLAFLGGQEASMGALEAATEHLTESLDLARQIGARPLVGIPTFGLGLVARSRGELERALGLFTECQELFQAPGDIWWLAQSLLGVATCLQRLDRPEDAAEYYRAGLALCRELRDNSATSWFLESLAGLAVGLGCIAEAATLMGASDGLRAGMGGVLVPELQEHRRKVEARVRAALGEDECARMHELGSSMEAEDAIECALGFLNAVEHQTAE